MKIWGITSDYGRSLFRWTILSLLFIIFFGFIFADYSVWPWFEHYFTDSTKILNSLDPGLHYDDNTFKGWYSPYYFSVVTFTTLGFGDVTPENITGQLWITMEVILGYIMLGGLISILANKLARRAS
ncbi:MAG: two pore domain potassium channel family protein [FCB group bacterium]|nr:two pore domain potassium channel family protein [FCB group bacterium]